MVKKIQDELLGATDLARAALLEVTTAESVGDLIGHEAEDSGAVTLFFECKLPGYPGWRWAASVAKAAADAHVTVLEVELLPGEGALLSPDWVPWSVRLAQYRESQAALEAEQKAAAAAAAELGEEPDTDADDDADEDDILVNDFSDFDDEIDGVDIDAVEIDGVDIDALEEDASDFDEEDDEDDEDEDEFDLDDDREDLINEEDLED